MPAGQRAPQGAQYAGLSHPPVGDLKAVQLFFNVLGGVPLFHGQLRTLVQRPAAGGQFPEHCLGPGVKVAHEGILLS